MKQIINNQPRHIQIGSIGEELAAEYLKSKGHSLIDRHFLQKWGEIDVITKKDDVVRFVEVKTVSYETRQKLEYAVSHETFRPEDNVHTAKLQRLGRAIATWIAKNRYEGEYQLDILTVRMVPREKYAVVDVIENEPIE